MLLKKNQGLVVSLFEPVRTLDELVPSFTDFGVCFSDGYIYIIRSHIQSLTHTHIDTHTTQSDVLLSSSEHKRRLKMCKRENGGNHCDCDKVHERIIAVNA